MAVRGGTLRIAEFNCNSLHARQDEVILLLDNDNINILICNNTRLNARTSVHFEGYELERVNKSDGSRKPGGVAIMVRTNISYSKVDMRNEEAICLEVVVRSDRIRLSSIYVHPGQSGPGKFIEDISKDDISLAANISISDWSARVGLGKGIEADAAGGVLMDYMESSGFTMMNDATPTFFSSSSVFCSCIDLCFVKLLVNGFTANWRVLDHYGSDHLPTLLTLITRGVTNNTSRRKNLEITDWSDYCKNLSADLDHLDEHVSLEDDGLEKYAEAIERLIMMNKRNATRTIKARRNGDTILSKKTRIVIETRRKLLKLRRLDSAGLDQKIIRILLNETSRSVKREIKRAAK